MAAPKRAETDQRATPLYALIYDTLRAHIEDASFPEGLVLGESLVARAFGASRVPAAAALKRLRDEGLIRDFEGRGYLVGDGTAAPVRRELTEAGLRLPEALAGELKLRNRREAIYPDVEHTVAAALSYGRFLLNESALAEHYGVSRTVAHEVLTRLERTGLVTQDKNQRWYAGPLTADVLRDHFEMRWLLEPVALGQAYDRLSPDELVAKLRRLDQVWHGRRTAANLERLEQDLHVDIVLRCRNAELRETIRRNQLPVIATVHSTLERFHAADEIERMLGEHRAVLEHLIKGERDAAMRALEQHVRRSLGPNLDFLKALGPVPANKLPPYLIAIEAKA